MISLISYTPFFHQLPRKLDHPFISWRMSIRTNKMKAVPVLLKRVMTVRSIFHERERDESLDGKMEKLRRELNKIKELFVRVKENEEKLLDTLAEVDVHLRKLDRKRLDQDMDAICNRIRDCAHKLLPMDAFDDSSKEEDHKSSQMYSSHPSSMQRNNELMLHQDPKFLVYPHRGFLMSLSIFPEDAVIHKRQTIYWWIGEGLVTNTSEKTAEEAGEDMIHELLKLNVIVPYGNGKCPIVNKFKINPEIRPQFFLPWLTEKVVHLGYYFTAPKAHMNTWLVLEQEKAILGDANRSIQTVFNFGARYLSFGSQWMNQMKNLCVLKLGRWQDSPRHHIEVVSQEFLKELKNLEHLSYLSLRGISRISELPPSIAQLKSLQILDLKACHNLETLPNDISSMKSLTHLIISRCYLLEGMPKGIEKLTQLQVLEGFVIGNSRNTPCRISDLANLKKLRRLSIHISSEAVIKDREFENWGELSVLEHLKISWGVSDTRYIDIQIILPINLKKLHLEGFPRQKIPEWMKPSKMPRGCKELKIVGGKLRSINYDEDKNEWGMEIVRLKYLKHLKVDKTNLQELFPLLRYAEIKKISNHSYMEWNIV